MAGGTHEGSRRHGAWRLRRAALALVGAAALAGAVLDSVGEADQALSVPPSPGPVSRDARYVSPRGSDSNPGTRERPWRTFRKALASARPGDTVVLLPGRYERRRKATEVRRGGTALAPITFRGEPGRRMPRILGFVRIAASHLRFHRLLFDGPTGRVQSPSEENPRGEEVQIWVDGRAQQVRDVEISSSEIRDSAWHAGVYLERAEDVRIVGNYIHDNGDFSDPGQANQSHGIYWASGSGLVANNVIEHNVAHGVQLYPQPSGVAVKHNTIVRNGRSGVLLGERASSSSIANNVIAYNSGGGVSSYELSGSRNLGVRNLLWRNRGGNAGAPDSGLVLLLNLEARPAFVGRRWKLARQSPGVDDGLLDPTITRDRNGTRRPRGLGPDIGAYEVR